MAAASGHLVVLGADGRELLRALYPTKVVVNVGHILDELKEDGLKGYLALTAGGVRLPRCQVVSPGDVYHFVEVAPPEEGWFARHNAIRAKFSPSQLAKSLPELRKQLGTDDPIYNLGRTSASATPLVLAVEAFACYARLLRAHVLSKRDWEFVIDMLDKMSSYYDTEEARQHVFSSCLRDYLVSSCPRLRLRVREAQAREGEGIPNIRVEAEIGDEWILVAIAGVRPESGFNGDSCVESVMYYAEYTLNKRAVYHWSHQLSCCPVLAVELAGPMIRVGGLARFTDKPAHEPLTPFLHMLKFLQDQDHLNVLARALAAIPATIASLVEFYTDLSSRVPQGERLLTRLETVDYPFRILSLGATEVRRLSYPGVESAIFRRMGIGRQHQLLFHVRLASGEQRIIKFCQRYGSQVHRLWAESGCAPKFKEYVLDGGWLLIDMEYLSPDDGWVLLTELDPNLSVRGPNAAGELSKHRLLPAEWEDCKKTVKAVSRAVHASHPHTVHGDLRQQNILYNLVTFKVAFIDFDWAGTDEGEVHRYPLWLNPHITWPVGVKSAALMFAEHDQQMLDSEAGFITGKIPKMPLKYA